MSSKTKVSKINYRDAIEESSSFSWNFDHKGHRFDCRLLSCEHVSDAGGSEGLNMSSIVHSENGPKIPWHMLAAFCRVLPENIRQYSLRIYRKDSLIATSSFQRYQFKLSSFVNTQQSKSFPGRLFKKMLVGGVNFLDGDIWLIGNLVVSGAYFWESDHSIWSEHSDELEFQQRVLESLKENWTGVEPPIALGIIQRGSVEDQIDGGSSDWKYFPVEPLMRLDISSKWGSFDDYYSSLRSRYRKKVRRVLRASSSIQVEELKLKDIERHGEQTWSFLQDLLDEIPYISVQPKPNTLAILKRELGQDYHVLGFFMEEKLVGFLSATQLNGTTEGHLIGYDRQVNEEFSLYKFMLTALVARAISAGSKRLYFGRTASISKINLGALPEPSGTWFHLTNPFARKMMPLVYNLLYKQDQSEERNVFKD